MAELLLELFSEEIPARMQAKAAEDLKQLTIAKLQEQGVAFSAAAAFATPRRLTLVVEGVPEQQPDTVVEKKGPRVGSPHGAIDGFLKSVGMTLDELEIRNTDKGEFYFSTAQQKGLPTAELLVPLLEAVIGAISWPKSMKWGESTIRWVRPLQNILCLFDGATLPVQFGHLTANNVSFGHRFLSKGSFAVTSFADYKARLLDAKVVLDREERKAKILADATAQAEAQGFRLLPDQGLLEEVAGLAEWPVVLMGRIDEQFMHVPKEVLSVSMRTHQKYFSLLKNDNSLAPHFITVANMAPIDGGEKIIAGNERVLRARLSDARFFWDQDRKKTLASRIDVLEKVVFHAKLGTLLDKAKRMEKLATIIASYTHTKPADAAKAARAALLAKADLVSEMVMEFPELQGIMGGYYAAHDKEDTQVAQAIADHYRPLGPSDSCPAEPVSYVVALADKIDTLVGLFAIGEKPTGSKDPFALRRAALGVIRILEENRLFLAMPLKPVLTEAMKLFAASSANTGELLEFFAERVKAILKSRDVRHDVINAVFDGGNEDNMARLIERANALQSFLDSQSGKVILAAYNRASSIVQLEEKKDGVSYNAAPSAATLVLPEEKQLWDALEKVRPGVEAALAKDQFEAAMTSLVSLKEPINDFFDKVIVNAEAADIRANRLKLLSQIRGLLDGVANFKMIED